MSVVICNFEGCKYRDSAHCCIKPFITLNAGGGCAEWYDKNGMRRPMPMYAEHPDWPIPGQVEQEENEVQSTLEATNPATDQN